MDNRSLNVNLSSAVNILYRVRENIEFDGSESLIEELDLAINELSIISRDFKEPDFENVSRLGIKYLCGNHHPHTHVIITCNTAELSEGVEAFTDNQYIKD